MTRWQQAGAVVVVAGLILLGWNAHRTFIYAADIYHKAQICEATQCVQVQQVAEELQDKTLPFIPAKKGTNVHGR